MNETDRLEYLKSGKALLDNGTFTADDYKLLKTRLICDNPQQFKATLGDIKTAKDLFSKHVLTRTEFDYIKRLFIFGCDVPSINALSEYASLYQKNYITQDEMTYLKNLVFQGVVTKMDEDILKSLRNAYDSKALNEREYNALRIATIYGEKIPKTAYIEKLSEYVGVVRNGYITSEDFDIIKRNVLQGKYVKTPEEIGRLSEYWKLLKNGAITETEYELQKKNILPGVEGDLYNFPGYQKIKGTRILEKTLEDRYNSATKKLELKGVASHKAAIEELQSLSFFRDTSDLVEKSKRELVEIEAIEASRKQEARNKRKATIKKAGALTILVVALVGAVLIVKELMKPNLQKTSGMVSEEIHGMEYEVPNEWKEDVARSKEDYRCYYLEDEGATIAALEIKYLGESDLFGPAGYDESLADHYIREEVAKKIPNPFGIYKTITADNSVFEASLCFKEKSVRNTTKFLDSIISSFNTNGYSNSRIDKGVVIRCWGNIMDWEAEKAADSIKESTVVYRVYDTGLGIGYKNVDWTLKNDIEIDKEKDRLKSFTVVAEGKEYKKELKDIKGTTNLPGNVKWGDNLQTVTNTMNSLKYGDKTSGDSYISYNDVEINGSLCDITLYVAKDDPLDFNIMISYSAHKNKGLSINDIVDEYSKEYGKPHRVMIDDMNDEYQKEHYLWYYEDSVIDVHRYLKDNMLKKDVYVDIMEWI